MRTASVNLTMKKTSSSALTSNSQWYTLEQLVSHQSWGRMNKRGAPKTTCRRESTCRQEATQPPEHSAKACAWSQTNLIYQETTSQHHRLTIRMKTQCCNSRDRRSRSLCNTKRKDFNDSSRVRSKYAKWKTKWRYLKMKGERSKGNVSCFWMNKTSNLSTGRLDTRKWHRKMMRLWQT